MRCKPCYNGRLRVPFIATFTSGGCLQICNSQMPYSYACLIAHVQFTATGQPLRGDNHYTPNENHFYQLPLALLGKLRHNGIMEWGRPASGM